MEGSKNKRMSVTLKKLKDTISDKNVNPVKTPFMMIKIETIMNPNLVYPRRIIVTKNDIFLKHELPNTLTRFICEVLSISKALER